MTIRSHQVRGIHWIPGKARLKQIAAPALSKIDSPCVAPVRLAQHRTQPVLHLWHRDQMHAIVH
jgi:hypothetical protein